MKTNFKFAIAAGLLAVSISAGFAFAAMTADEAIKQRKLCMKSGHGGVFAIAVPIVKGERHFDADALKAAYDNEDKQCANYDALFGVDTQQGTTEKTAALPAIWTDPEGFKAAGAAWYAASQKLRAATDDASFKAAFPAVGASCKGCHEKFRAATP